MSIAIVRLGSARLHDEGLRIGTVRRPPRGVKKSDFAKLDYYDLWFPNLAPSNELLKSLFPISDEITWKAFARRFVKEMKETAPAKDLDLLAALSHQTNISIGCYCEKEHHCHRLLLRDLLEARDADLR